MQSHDDGMLSSTILMTPMREGDEDLSCSPGPLKIDSQLPICPLSPQAKKELLTHRSPVYQASTQVWDLNVSLNLSRWYVFFCLKPMFSFLRVAASGRQWCLGRRKTSWSWQSKRGTTWTLPSCHCAPPELWSCELHARIISAPDSSPVIPRTSVLDNLV